MCRTIFLKNALSHDTATFLYETLRDGVEWEDGIRTRSGGFTRKGKILQMDDDNILPVLLPHILGCLGQAAKARYRRVMKTASDEEIDYRKMQSLSKYTFLGVYLNYYEDGHAYTPMHCHRGQHQLVISLGETRTLNIGKHSYGLSSGSAIMFGSSSHGVPQEPHIKEGRISIAVFMSPIKNIDVYGEEAPSTEYADDEIEIDCGDGTSETHEALLVEDDSALASDKSEDREQLSFLDDLSTGTSVEMESSGELDHTQRVDHSTSLSIDERVRYLTRMFGDVDDRAALLKEIYAYLKEVENDAEDRADFFQQLEERDEQARYDFFNEWRTDDIDSQLFGETQPSTNVWAERLYAMYVINELTRGGAKCKPPTKSWADRKVAQYVDKPYDLIRAAEKRHSLPLLGIKWEEQLVLREEHAYEGPYLLDEEGYVAIVQQ